MFLWIRVHLRHVVLFADFGYSLSRASRIAYRRQLCDDGESLHSMDVCVCAYCALLCIEFRKMLFPEMMERSSASHREIEWNFFSLSLSFINLFFFFVAFVC